MNVTSSTTIAATKNPTRIFKPDRPLAPTAAEINCPLDLARVARRLGAVSPNGYDGFYSDFDVRDFAFEYVGFTASIIFLSRFNRRKTFNLALSSYGMKHIIENWIDQHDDLPHLHISNGVLIIAAMCAGFVFDEPDSPNPFFNIALPRGWREKLPPLTESEIAEIRRAIHLEEIQK